ncbi:hypothetical protein PILCRDRAFT_813732 [Piloderma croceum F 1598]|uniref:Uncharacterized protein n=1 Tax=Piloderma croceum (strain F 1598) TaxID=765440 RepID=A0A0C3BQH4_PILCF|nr:hypothetical protein PILCRDRAFT_813732 [Piloderma croceum F 1598]
MCISSASGWGKIKCSRDNEGAPFAGWLHCRKSRHFSIAFRQNITPNSILQV